MLALGGCGDDSGGDGASRSGATSGQKAGATGTTGDVAQQDRGAAGGEGKAPKLGLGANREPVPKNSKPPGRYTRRDPVPKRRLKAAEQAVFDQSRYLCKQLGVEAMRREYRITSSDPREVARAVAGRTYLPEMRDAVYSGCLAGLRSRD
jgi:hypothetical protein